VFNAILTPVIRCKYVRTNPSAVKADCPRCFGAASAKDGLDVVIRDAINAGDIPGTRYLANGKDIARDGDRITGITAYADGPDEMREVIQHHVGLGVDQ
jgi:hypothetical protein